MKMFFLSLPLIAALAVAGFFILHKRTSGVVHYHAGFVVYVDGIKQDYSSPQYMSIEPCSTGATSQINPGGEAHLHDNIGDIVHVHNAAVPWQVLFKTAGVIFPDRPVAGYVNGKQVPDIMHQLIRPYDSAVIIIGKKRAVKPSDYVTKTRIQSVESKSELCGK